MKIFYLVCVIILMGLCIFIADLCYVEGEINWYGVLVAMLSATGGLISSGMLFMDYRN